jgi:hypothetical protein
VVAVSKFYINNIFKDAHRARSSSIRCAIAQHSAYIPAPCPQAAVRCNGGKQIASCLGGINHIIQNPNRDAGINNFFNGLPRGA